MKYMPLIIAIVMLSVGLQSQGYSFAHTIMSEPSDKKDDPSYKMYKDGYNRILDEKWEEARKIFAEFITKFPKSEYADDAEYWSAYALEHVSKDKDKNFRAFKDFLYKYPESNYYDDAVAEMFKLKTHLHVGKSVNKSGAHVYISDEASGVSVDSNGALFAIPDAKHGYRYSYAFTQPIPNVSNKLRIAQRQLQRQIRGITTSSRAPITAGPTAWTLSRMFPPNENLDPETRLKMEALSALGDTKEDSISYRTLRDVALDRTQARPLRETAMDALSNFKTYDPLPVFVEIAKKDTSEEMQNTAIDYIGQLSNDKNRSVEMLGDLFNVIPSYRSDKREWVLSSIAEIGNDKAVDFLSNVALTNNDYDLRSSAVSYLGNIGSDRARTALYEILRKSK